MQYFAMQMELAIHKKQVGQILKIQPNLSHLLYTCDLLIFIKANQPAAHCLSQIFRNIECVAGLKVNELKTKCYFEKYMQNKEDIL